MLESPPTGLTPDASFTAKEQTPLARRILRSAEAAAAVRKGIARAVEDCEKWSGYWPTDFGCENLLQVRAAEELHEQLATMKLGWLTLEEPLGSIMYERTAKPGRPHSGLTKRKRADIAIWNKAERVYAVIEIKRAERDCDWQRDLEKLARILARYSLAHGNHVRYCVLGVFISRRRADLVEARGKALKALAASVAARFGLHQRTFYEKEQMRHWNASDANGWTCGVATVELRC